MEVGTSTRVQGGNSHSRRRLSSRETGLKIFFDNGVPLLATDRVVSYVAKLTSHLTPLTDLWCRSLTKDTVNCTAFVFNLTTRKRHWGTIVNGATR